MSSLNIFFILSIVCECVCKCMGRSIVGWGSEGPDTALENHEALGFLKKSGTDHPLEAIGPIGSNCFSREVGTVICEIS